MPRSLRLPGTIRPRSTTVDCMDGGVLDNLPVSTRASPDGPLIAVSTPGGGGWPASLRRLAKAPGIGDTA